MKAKNISFAVFASHTGESESSSLMDTTSPETGEYTSDAACMQDRNQRRVSVALLNETRVNVELSEDDNCVAISLV